MNVFVSAVLAASQLFAGALASGCANDMSDGKSGETHFLCSSDADCSRHFGNDEYYCGAQKYCALKSDGGTSHLDGGQSGSGDETGAGGRANGSGGNTAGGSGGTAGGDFASCKTPPNSTCSEAETCAALGCPSLQYDEHGCQRQECKKDDDCAADERCATNNCESPSACTVQNGMCMCGGPAICGQKARCNPTATTGPRGDWVSLGMTVIQSPCEGPTYDRCTKTWQVTPDGHFTFTDGSQADGGVPAEGTLDTAQMFEIAGAVNGTGLRLAMRDGVPCAQSPALDLSLMFSLELSTQTAVSGEVGACMGGDNVYALIYNVLSHADVTAGSDPGGNGSNGGPPAQAAVTFSSVPVPGKTCNHTVGQFAFPSNYTASVLQELNCDLSTGCRVDDHVVVNGDAASFVNCSVVPSGDNYDVQLSLSVQRASYPIGTFHVNGTVSKTGGTVAIQETNSVAGGGGSQPDCSLTITPTLGLVGPGKIWGRFECGAFRDQTDISETGCDLSGLFLFENCKH